jgi:hypothetical protein
MIIHQVSTSISRLNPKLIHTTHYPRPPLVSNDPNQPLSHIPDLIVPMQSSNVIFDHLSRFSHQFGVIFWRYGRWDRLRM